MALRLILGNSGSGKSCYLYQKIIEASGRWPESKFLVIVPEQFTMQTQMELAGMHPDKGLLNIDVLSFQRLAHRVFQEMGADDRRILEETGKTLLLRRAASKKEKELKVLKSNLKKPGYLRQMKSMISELTQYDIDAQKMERLLAEAEKKPTLYYKLKDISLLYEAFREELQGKYITAEERLEVLCQVASRSKLLRGCTIALDGFTGFTPIQQKFLGELLCIARDVYVTVCVDVREDFLRIRGEHELFYLSKKTIRMLLHMAKERGCEAAEPHIMKERELPRFRETPELGYLERNLFRAGRAGGFPKANTGAISFHTAADPRQEAHFAARTIRGLLKENFRYRDIAVIVGDLASYANYIPQVFQEYDVPCFMDSTRTVFSNPLIEFVRAALDLVQQDYTCTAVFRCLRTRLCGIEDGALDLLENYVLASGVRGFSAWRAPFYRTPRGFSDEQLAQCEELRGRIMEALLPFTECMRSAKTDARQKTEALRALLDFYGMRGQMEGYAEALQKKEELRKEFLGIYDMVSQLLDKLEELLGDECLSVQEYAQLLEAGFEEARIRMVPPAADRVQVGDIERTRLQNIRVLIFLGLNDGWVPAAGQGGSLLSDMERESLKDCGVELAPTARENSYIQKFYLYLNLTKPRERLYLCCSKAAMDGSPMRPSYVFHSVNRLFPELHIQDEDPCRFFADRVYTPANGQKYFLEGLWQIREKEPSFSWLELYNWYRRSGEGEQVQKLVRAAFTEADQSGIGRAAARELYGNLLDASVSRLEKFASCAFAYFLQYGLGLAQREEYEFRPLDMGNILHSAIELYSRKVAESGYGWAAMPDDARDALADQCVEETAQQYGQQILHDSASNEYMIQRMKYVMRRTAWAFHRQIAAGRFYPAGFEMPFSSADGLEAACIALSGEEQIRLKGRIDRMDLCEIGDRLYVKVVDYKSGFTFFDLTALYYGQQLQLVVYLNAAMQMVKARHPGKEVLPGGIFYYHMKDPMLRTDGEPDEEEAEQMLLKELRPDGLVNSEECVIGAMDARIEKESLVIPVAKNKDGSLAKRSGTATMEQFEKMSAFVQKKMQELGRRILSGEIAAVPYVRNRESACDRCAFGSVCCFDGRIPGTVVNRLRELSKEEIWRRILEGEETAQDTDAQEGNP